MTDQPSTQHEKGTCFVCGFDAPDSVICDRCFADRWVKPTFALLTDHGDNDD